MPLSPFSLFLRSDLVLLPLLALDTDLPTFASWVARIRDMYHHTCLQCHFSNRFFQQCCFKLTQHPNGPVINSYTSVWSPKNSPEQGPHNTCEPFFSRWPLQQDLHSLAMRLHVSIKDQMCEWYLQHGESRLLKCVHRHTYKHKSVPIKKPLGEIPKLLQWFWFCIPSTVPIVSKFSIKSMLKGHFIMFIIF
jgi:hypothetical protein